MQNSKTYLLPLARLLMCSLFLWDGVLQLRNPGGAVQYFASLGVPVPKVAIWISVPIHLPGFKFLFPHSDQHRVAELAHKKRL